LLTALRADMVAVPGNPLDDIKLLQNVVFVMKTGVVLYTRRLKQKHRGYGVTFYIDEVFVKIRGKQHYRDLRISAFNEWSRAVS
jgi:hypothetical protein